MNRFWSKISVGKPDECWEWQASRVREYGKFWLNGKYQRAHRVAYELTHGSIPNNMLVRHKCDNPLCCNPSHLLVGSAQDNMNDKVERNRQHRPTGRKNGRAILTQSQVNSILEDTRSQAAIAREYGVSAVTIHYIKQGKRWNL